MEEQGVAKDTRTYNLSMGAYEKAGEWDKVLALLADMTVNGVEKDLHTYRAAISACDNADGKTEEDVQEILGEMDMASLLVIEDMYHRKTEAGHVFDRVVELAARKKNW